MERLYKIDWILHFIIYGALIALVVMMIALMIVMIIKVNKEGLASFKWPSKRSKKTKGENKNV